VSAVGIASLAIVVVVLAGVAFGPNLFALLRRAPRRSPHHYRSHVVDPGRALRAERKAELLMRSVLDPADYEAYKALGFLHAYGTAERNGSQPTYGYLIYPHKPLVSYDIETGELLNEHCVSFPDRHSDFGERLPDADDVLAKWMALRGDERVLIAAANMHLPGRQLDPDHVRRDIVRMSEWVGRASPASSGHADVA